MNKTNRAHAVRSVIAFIVSLLWASIPAAAKDLYVSVTGSDSNTGSTSTSPLRTISAASDIAGPGDTTWIMPGEYVEPIKPVRSGKAGSPITYRAANQDKRPVIRSSTGISVKGLSYITVDGIAINGGKRAPNSAVTNFADIENASNVIIRNGDFRYANGGHGIRIRASTYVTIEGSALDFVGEYEDATGHANGDSIGVDEASSKILIRNNDLRHGGHNLINVNGRESVIRDNFMDNSWRDVYGGEAGYRSAAIKGQLNVFERNHIARNGVGAYHEDNALLKIQGDSNIARYNILANANEQALVSDSGESAPVSWRSRIYHNTFYNSKSAAWRMRFYPAGGKSVGQGVFVNNLVQRTRTDPAGSKEDTDVMFLVSDAGAGPTAGSKVIGNIFAPASGTAPKVLLNGFDGDIDVSSAENLYPSLFGQNSAKKATFAVEAPVKMQDFMLAKGSAGIEAGVFLTRVEGTGSSSKVPVADTYFFSDGRGLVKGDIVQLEGNSVTATVLRVDHAGKALELDRTIDFRAGQGIALAYEGLKPDVGAFEYGLENGPVPTAPSNVIIE